MPVNSQVTSDTMRKWNNLIKFSRDKGYAGKPELDHDEDLRQKVFSEYNKANPNDTLDYNLVKPIQSEIQAYKSKALDAMKNGKMIPAEGVTPNNFMSGISKVDGIYGKLTSNFSFPEAYILNKQTGEKKSVGFAPRVDLLAALNK